MKKPKILENRKFDKGSFRVVLEFEEETVSGYVDDDGEWYEIYRVDSKGKDVDWGDIKYSEKWSKFRVKYLPIFEKMESEYEIGFHSVNIDE